MIENIDNTLQLIITGLCTLAAIFGGTKNHRKEWILVGLFTGVFFLGLLYWQLYLVFYLKTPQYSGIPYVSWYASYIFLLLLLVEFRGHARKLKFRRFWPVFIFTGGMCIFFMQYGAYLSNTVSAVLMSLLISFSLDGLFGEDTKKAEVKGGKSVYLFTLLFCALEYCMWFSSCIWSGNSLGNPYFWFDFMLSIDFILITLSVRKAVAYELY